MEKALLLTRPKGERENLFSSMRSSGLQLLYSCRTTRAVKHTYSNSRTAGTIELPNTNLARVLCAQPTGLHSGANTHSWALTCAPLGAGAAPPTNTVRSYRGSDKATVCMVL